MTWYSSGLTFSRVEGSESFASVPIPRPVVWVYLKGQIT